jgi:aspartyl-tRNA(Asn)/glutamyl-tRNA(Gln) amidotransferase subunit C
MMAAVLEAMSVTITAAGVEHVAALARLRFDQQATTKLTCELISILQYVNLLNKVDSDQAAPTAYALDPRQSVLRPDIASPGMSRDLALQLAPAAHEGMFRVPRVVEV